MACVAGFRGHPAEALLQHDEAEEELVIVVTAGFVVLEKSPDRLRAEQVEDERFFVPEGFGQFTAH